MKVENQPDAFPRRLEWREVADAVEPGDAHLRYLLLEDIADVPARYRVVDAIDHQHRDRRLA